MTVLEARLTGDADIERLVDIGLSGSKTTPPGTRVLSYVFRGQSAEFPGLVPKADRPGAVSEAGDISQLWGYRADMMGVLKHYKRTIHNQLVDKPKDDDWLEWMALIQHFGGPTRLLDFTESALVGLYFAAKEVHPKLGSYLWLIHQERGDLFLELQKAFPAFKRFEGFEPDSNEPDGDFLTIRLLCQMADGIAAGRRILHFLHDSSDYVALRDAPMLSDEEAVLLNELTGVVVARPFRMNRRLLAQQGCFAVPLRWSKFMLQLVPDSRERKRLERKQSYRALSKLPTLGSVRRRIVKERPEIVRLWLPPSAKDSLLERLRHYNVTGQSLFPDFEGYTQAMNEVQRQSTVFGY